MSARRVPAGAIIIRSLQIGISSAVALASLWGLLGGCREQSTAPVDRNHAPNTFLVEAPGDSQTAFYRVSLHWYGSDNDGVVVAYDVAVTESLPQIANIQWTRTHRTDSLIVFPVEQTRSILGHRFYVRAVDNEGKVDPTPPYVFFGARDPVPPVVLFKRAIAFGPNPGQQKDLTSTNELQPTDTIPTGWGVRFEWTGTDTNRAINPDGSVVFVGHISQYLHRLLPIESGFLGMTLSDTSASYSAEFFDRFPQGDIYTFEVRAQDEAGLSGSTGTIRAFVWNQDPISRIQRCIGPNGRDSIACFVSNRGVVHFSGDTLPLPSTNDPSDSLPVVRFRTRAYDPDPPNGDHSVQSLEWRYSVGVVFTSWTPLDLSDPSVNLPNLPTNDYIAMVRATDQLGRVEGNPDSLRFYVNFVPRFVTTADTLSQQFTQTPLPGNVYTVSQLTNGLPCSFWVVNKDQKPGEKILYSYRFEGRSAIFSVPSANNPWDNHAPYTFFATLPSGNFTPGSYTLTVQATDNQQAGGDTRGSRTATRHVAFTVVP